MGLSSPKVTLDHTQDNQSINQEPFKSAVSVTMESPEQKAKLAQNEDENLLEYGIKKLFHSVSKLRKQSMHMEIRNPVESLQKGFKLLLSEDDNESAEIKSRKSSQKGVGANLLSSEIASKVTVKSPRDD